jgi:hypothetical protein
MSVHSYISVTLDPAGLSFSNNGYQFGSTKANVGVCKGLTRNDSFLTSLGLWYYEVTLSSNTSARIGWATNAFKPANKYEESFFVLTS